MLARFLLGLLGCVPSAAFGACGSGPAAELPLTEAHGKLLVPVGIQGSPQQIALDTGAGITVISTETANQLEILHDFDHHFELGGVGGANSVLYIGQVGSFDLGRVHLAQQRFPIVDLALRTASGAPVAGFLGADILHGYDVEIDIPGGRLALWRAAGCDGVLPGWAAAVQPVTFALDDNNHIMVPLQVDDASLTGILDTGAAELSLTTRATLRAGVAEDTLAEDPEIHGTGVNNRSWTGRLHRFGKVRFAGISFSRVVAGVVPSADIAAYNGLAGADALLGVSLLRQSRMFISYQNHTLYVQGPSRSTPE